MGGEGDSWETREDMNEHESGLLGRGRLTVQAKLIRRTAMALWDRESIEIDGLYIRQ